MELMRFIFQDGWHFVGTVFLIYVAGEALEGIARAAFSGKKGARND